MNIHKSSVTKPTPSTVLKFLGCALLALLAADLQAQLLYKTKFSAVEGYTNGWVIGQPSIGNKWSNANANWQWFADNGISPAGYTPLNNGKSWWPEGATEPWYIATATNTTAPGGGQMKIASDGNFGTNAMTYFFKMDFPTTRRGPITVTWDWQFVCTNEIPVDFDPTNNTYNSVLPGYDQGFTLSDYANCTAQEDSVGNPNWKYGELGTPCRLSTYQDCRYNILGTCGGGGNWNDYGPVFKDGKVLHMKLITYVTNAPPEYMNTFEVFAQRDGEEVWQTAFKEPTYIEHWIRDGVDWDKNLLESGFRRCPGETDPESGVNCIMLWMNGNQFSRYTLVSNIRVVGPDPVPVPKLSIEKVGTDIKMTFDGWLEAADNPEGPYTTVAVQSPYQIPASAAARKFYRAEN